MLNLGKNLFNIKLTSKNIMKSYKTLSFYIYNSSYEKIESNFHHDNFEIKLLTKAEKNEKKLPYIWLRDFCKCKNCFDNTNQQTLVNLKNIALNIKPNDISNEEDGSVFKITCRLNLSN